MDEPDDPNSNGPNGRDGKGRFAPGNPGGPGSPVARHARQIRERLDSALFKTCSEDRLLAAIDACLRRAEAGDVAALMLILERIAGPPIVITVDGEVTHHHAAMAMQRVMSDPEALDAALKMVARLKAVPMLTFANVQKANKKDT